MRDTIDLLEAIGRDASLRHASPVELTKALAQAQPSEALAAAAAAGDGSHLAMEFGQKPMQAPQISQTPAHEEDESEGEGNEEPLAPPSTDGGTSPLHH